MKKTEQPPKKCDWCNGTGGPVPPSGDPCNNCGGSGRKKL